MIEYPKARAWKGANIFNWVPKQYKGYEHSEKSKYKSSPWDFSKDFPALKPKKKLRHPKQ